MKKKVDKKKRAKNVKKEKKKKKKSRFVENKFFKQKGQTIEIK